MPRTTKTAKTPKEKAKKAKEPKFTVTFGYNGAQEVLKGDDLIAIFKDWSPRIFKTVITLSVKSGKQELKRRLPVVQARRISGNYQFADIYAHQLLKFLG